MGGAQSTFALKWEGGAYFALSSMRMSGPVMHCARSAWGPGRGFPLSHVAWRPSMFSSFRCPRRTVSFRQPSRCLSKRGKYARGVQKKNLQLEKLCGTTLRSGLSSIPKCRNCCGSSLGVVDESSTNSTSKSQSRDAEHGCCDKEERKKSLSLGTVALPAKLESALNNAMSSKS